MATKQSKKKVNIIIYSVILAFLATFAIMTSLSENGYLPFSFPKWSDFGTIFGYKDQISESPVSMHFIDVGNADCVLVKTPDCNILVDAGDKDDEGKIVQYLRKFDVKKLDLVIATHPHTDHIGSMEKVLKSFEVGEMIMPKMPEEIMPTTDEYANLVKTISANSINQTYAQAGRVITLGDTTLKLLTPLDTYDNINDMSVVVKLTYKSFSAMLMGDAGTDVERDIIIKYPKEELKADVLKIGHHGSAFSTSDEFIRLVGAKTYFIPCGVNNEYEHPAKTVLNTLKSIEGCEIYRADYDGNVVVLSDGENTTVLNEG